MGRQRPEAGVFVGRNCSFRLVLCFLFPLVHHFVWFSQPLIMSRKGEVRSSELESSLSLSEDRKALEVTSPSIPYKARMFAVF